MNKAIIKEEMGWLLEAINEQAGIISRHNDHIPQIEYDILMENLRKFYENLRLLKRMEDPHFASEKKGAPVIARQPAPAPAPFKSTTSPPVAAPEPQDQPQPRPAAPPRQPAPALSRQTGKSSEIDLFATEESAMNSRLKEAREKTFSPKIPSERIDNLKTAIIINDKFMFINELFEGNLREYNETIETLNGFKTLSQAADYLDLMRKKNFWNTGSPAFKKLKELVERRF
jgi:hypothetical protein